VENIDCFQLINFLSCLPFRLVIPYELDKVLKLSAEDSGIQDFFYIVLLLPIHNDWW